jgi:hypothetical protein
LWILLIIFALNYIRKTNEKKDNSNTDFNSVAFNGIVRLEEKQRL